MKKGGSLSIRDFERDAVFQAEGGGWSSKTLAELGPDVLSSISNQVAQSIGFSKVWIRNDGALARMNVGNASMVLDLPQALKYEAQWKGIKDQRPAAARKGATAGAAGRRVRRISFVTICLTAPPNFVAGFII